MRVQPGDAPLGERGARDAALRPRPAGCSGRGAAEPETQLPPGTIPAASQCLLPISAPQKESEETGRERLTEASAEMCELGWILRGGEMRGKKGKTKTWQRKGNKLSG